MKFSPKCRTKKLGMIYTVLRSFCSFLNWEGAIIQPQIEPRKIPEQCDRISDHCGMTEKLLTGMLGFKKNQHDCEI